MEGLRSHKRVVPEPGGNRHGPPHQKESKNSETSNPAVSPPQTNSLDETKTVQAKQTISSSPYRASQNTISITRNCQTSDNPKQHRRKRWVSR